ncbi:MAG: lysoplasmalogenase [Stenotrophobium sp.]
MPTHAFAIAAAVSAILAIAADWNERRHPAFYILKPLTTVLIIGIAAQSPPGDARWMLLAALGLSLLGDICLMFEGNKFFIGGLGSFLLAHLLFIPVLLHGIAQPALPPWSAALALYGILLFAWLLPRTGSLKFAVGLYGLALIGLAFAAIARWHGRHDLPAELAMLGALLFVLSDSSLAIRKFVGAYAGAQAVILSTYWAAIGLIAYAATLPGWDLL